MLAIPLHMLVDEKGKIFTKHAKPPSQVAELEKQLDELPGFVHKDFPDVYISAENGLLFSPGIVFCE